MCVHLRDNRKHLVRSTLDHVQSPLNRQEAVRVLNLKEGKYRAQDY